MSSNMVSDTMKTVSIARNIKRPTAREFIDQLFDEFMEFHGDRYYADDGAIVGGIASFRGEPVTVIGIQKGHTLEENVACNFGQPNPEGYRKALRLMKQAEKFNRPVICIINSSGAYCGIGAEERGQGLAIAENLMEMMTLKTPVVSVVTGEGGSGGALALSVADSIFMLENAVYSVISPEGCASILWKDSSKAPDAAEALKLTAKDLHKFGIVETVISEENRTNEEICDELKLKLVKEIKRLNKLDIGDLLDDRYEKFRKIGSV